MHPQTPRRCHRWQILAALIVCAACVMDATAWADAAQQSACDGGDGLVIQYLTDKAP
jgi:hypothetical protein